ncbi:L-serine ammonia-lyase, partial [Klebsiella pneumoniae]|nr:L-serine ammonia-lyase [Klebsiella pneumoniae]
GSQPVVFDYQRDMRLLDEDLPYHPNAMRLNAFQGDVCLFSQTYYSDGGGFIVEQAEIDAPPSEMGAVDLPYEFSSGAELLALCKTHGLSVGQLMMANECAWRSEAE